MQLQLEVKWREEKQTGNAYISRAGLADEDWIVGLSGIAMMGLGYELPDTYLLMGGRWLQGRAEDTLLDPFSELRAKELLDSGKRPVGKFSLPQVWGGADYVEDYERLREDGEEVHRARLAYMNVRFERGEHPDTHADFWEEWEEPEVPVLNKEPAGIMSQSFDFWATIALIGGVAFLAILAGTVFWLRRRARA